MFETPDDYIKIIEWPELIYPKPTDRVDILFEYSKSMNSREVKTVGFGKCKDYKFNEI
jgi:tRNA A37 threonylcarbamoyladenosine biosynthesis protein TsaE